jgi:hypothetical protein
LTEWSTVSWAAPAVKQLHDANRAKASRIDTNGEPLAAGIAARRHVIWRVSFANALRPVVPD